MPSSPRSGQATNAMKTKVSCPKCRAALKSAKQLAAGKNVVCPRCKAAFAVPGGEIARGAPPAMGILEQAHGIDDRGSKIEDRGLTLDLQPGRSAWIVVLAGAFLFLGAGA